MQRYGARSLSLSAPMGIRIESQIPRESQYFKRAMAGDSTFFLILHLYLFL
jgi:hypothetical protein